MKLEHERMERYICEITKKLDELAGIAKESCTSFHHYIYLSAKMGKKYLPVRVPGGTVGGITLDDNGCIKEIFLYTDYVVKTYPENINEIINQIYKGNIIEL